MPTGRDRELDQSIILQGYLWNIYIGWWTRDAVYQNWKRNRDVIGNYPEPNNFHLTRLNASPLLLNGQVLWNPPDPTPIYKEYLDCPVFTPALPSPDGKFPELTSLEQQNFAWEVLAETNPSLPYVSVPTAIGELKDLPDLVRDWGGSLLKKVAKGHLSWRWAIKPMIRDITMLMDFRSAVDKRIRELVNLRDKGFVRKRAGLGKSEDLDEGTSEITIESTLGWYTGWRDIKYKQKVWGTVQWNVDPTFVLPRTDEGLARFAKRLTFGITTYEALATAWELLPWSWMIDWFVGIGDTISAYNNTIPMTHSRICIMQYTKSESSWRALGEGASSTWIHHHGNMFKRHEELRRFANISPFLPFSVTTTVPFLDKGKWSILGALAVLRNSRR